MAEIDDKIKDLLSNPESLNNILQLVKGFTGGGAGAGAPSANNTPAEASAAAPEPSAPVSFTPDPPAQSVPAMSSMFPSSQSVPAMSALFPSQQTASPIPDLSLLSKLDPKYITAAMNVLGEYSRDDDKIVLLNALKPHLRDQRRSRVDKAAQILRITKSIRAALNGLGISGGASNV